MRGLVEDVLPPDRGAPKYLNGTIHKPRGLENW